MKYSGFVLVILIVLIGCGSSGKSSSGGCCTVPGINVEVVSPAGAAAIDDNSTLTLPITVQVTNDSSNAGVTWTLTPAVLGTPAGSLSTQQPLSVTYTPPTGVTSSVQVTVTATSVTDPTRSAAIPITAYPPLVAYTSSAYFGLATAFVNTNYTCIGLADMQIPCDVAVLGGVPPYTWSLGNSFLPQGMQFTSTLDLSHVSGAADAVEIIGEPTVSGVFPFTLITTDATGNSVTQALSLNVAPGQLKVVTPTVLNVLPGQPYTPIQLQASGGTPPYTWSLAPGYSKLPSWVSLSASGVISANPPANFSDPSIFAVQVTDSQSPVPAQAVFPAPTVSTNTGLITLTVGQSTPSDYQCGAQVANSVQTSSPYAFVFTGFDANGPVTYSGSFTADAQGNLTGEEDIVRSTGAQLAQPLSAGSSILFDVSSRGSDTATPRGCLTLKDRKSVV